MSGALDEETPLQIREDSAIFPPHPVTAVAATVAALGGGETLLLAVGLENGAIDVWWASKTSDVSLCVALFRLWRMRRFSRSLTRASLVPAPRVAARPRCASPLRALRFSSPPTVATARRQRGGALANACFL